MSGELLILKYRNLIGVFLLLFGGCGAMNNVKLITNEKMMNMADSVIDNMEVEVEQEALDSTDLMVLSMISDSIYTDSITQKVDLKSTIKNLMHMSDYFKKWAVILGYIGLGISILFLVSGIFCFNKNKYTIPLAITILSIGILFSLFKIYILLGDTSSSYMLSGLRFSFFASILLYAILIVVIWLSEKESYVINEN